MVGKWPELLATDDHFALVPGGARPQRWRVAPAGAAPASTPETGVLPEPLALPVTVS